MEKDNINPWDWQDMFGFSQAWTIENPGTVIEVSGQTSTNKKAEVLHKNDFTAQTRQVFENMRTVLDESGANFEDVVKLQAFITDSKFVEEYGNVQSEFFPGESPAQTLLVVKSLALPELMVEVEATAYTE